MPEFIFLAVTIVLVATKVKLLECGRASQIWGWNSLAGNQCQRWLALFSVFGRDAEQAPGLAVLWRPSVGEGGRAGTRPAPTGF